MPHSLLASLPIIPALIDEASRVVTTIWILPYVKDTAEGVILGIVTFRQFLGQW